MMSQVCSKCIVLRETDDARATHKPVAGADIRVVSAVADKQQQEHKKKFGAALGALPPSAAPPIGAGAPSADGAASGAAEATGVAPLSKKPPDLNSLGRQYSGRL